MLDGANTYTGATVIVDGTLRVGSATAMSSGSVLAFGSNSATTNTTTVGTLDLTAASGTVAGLNVFTNSTSSNAITIGAGKKLTVNGNVTVGLQVNNAFTKLTASGLGRLEVDSAAGTFLVGNGPGGTNNRSNAMLDMSGLSDFSTDLTTGTMTVGATGDNSGSFPSSILLANTSNSISAANLNVGASGLGSSHALRLGAGTNVLHVDNIRLGSGSRDAGTINFQSGSGSITLADRTGSGRTNISLGNAAAQGTGYAATNVFDSAGHNADLLIGTLTMARPRGQVRSPTPSISTAGRSTSRRSTWPRPRAPAPARTRSRSAAAR